MMISGSLASADLHRTIEPCDTHILSLLSWFDSSMGNSFYLVFVLFVENQNVNIGQWASHAWANIMIPLRGPSNLNFMNTLKSQSNSDDFVLKRTVSHRFDSCAITHPVPNICNIFGVGIRHQVNKRIVI